VKYRSNSRSGWSYCIAASQPPPAPSVPACLTVLWRVGSKVASQYYISMGSHKLHGRAIFIRTSRRSLSGSEFPGREVRSARMRRAKGMEVLIMPSITNTVECALHTGDGFAIAPLHISFGDHGIVVSTAGLPRLRRRLESP